MTKLGSAIACLLVFTGTAFLVDGMHHEPPANCTDTLLAAERQAQQNMDASAPIPVGAPWPTKTLDILGDTLYDPDNPATLNALYWQVQFEDVLPAQIGTTAMTCPAGGK